MKNILTITLATALALGMNAAPLRPGLTPDGNPLSLGADVAMSRGRVASPTKAVSGSNESKPAASSKASVKKFAAGEAGVLLDQSFGFLSEGSPDSPVQISLDGQRNIPEDLIGALDYGWGGSGGLYQAGGNIGLINDNGSSLLWSPDMSVPAGNIYVTFNCRSIEEYGSVNVELWGSNDGSSYTHLKTEIFAIDDYFNSYTRVIETSELEGYVYFYVDFYKETGESDLLINNVKVVSRFAPPLVYGYSDFTGDSFIASWAEVTDAEKYIFNLAKVDINGAIQEMLVQREVVGIECLAEITPGNCYSYWVNAVTSDGVVSGNSNVESCRELMAPTNVRGAIRSDFTGADVEWDASPGANAYLLYPFFNRQATEDGAYTVVDADFSGISSPGTLDSPQMCDQIDVVFDQLPQWNFRLGATIDGAVGIVGTQELWDAEGLEPVIQSPIYNFSEVKDETVTLKVKAASKTGNKLMMCMISRLAGWHITGYLETEALTPEFKEYSAQLSCEGSEYSYIAIFPLVYDSDVFFESIEVSAEVEAYRCL